MVVKSKASMMKALYDRRKKKYIRRVAWIPDKHEARLKLYVEKTLGGEMG